MKLIKIDFDQEEARISRTPTSVFSWMQVNNGSVVQTVAPLDEVNIAREATYEFRWNRATKVSGKNYFIKRIFMNCSDSNSRYDCLSYYFAYFMIETIRTGKTESQK